MAADGPTIVIAAGGTGGHIYPGLALAEAVLRAAPTASVSFVGTARGMERTLVPAAGFELDLVTMRPFNNQGWKKLAVPASLARGSWQARRILRARGADVAVTMGGYSGVPLVVGARLAGVPTLVHEPGSVPGQANRLAARFTAHVATSFPDTDFPGLRQRWTGYPLRAEIATFDRDALRGEARAAFRLEERTAMILVTGGSQGALTLNRLALGLADRWAQRDDVRIVLKAGSRTHDQIERALADNPGAHLVDLVPYIERMDHAYAAADMAICRAGAATIAELAVVGLPSVLVPLALHEHDEQRHNAAPLVASGGAVVVDDADADAETVGPILEATLGDPDRLEEMRRGMTVAGNADAADDLASWTLELAGVR